MDTLNPQQPDGSAQDGPRILQPYANVDSAFMSEVENKDFRPTFGNADPGSLVQDVQQGGPDWHPSDGSNVGDLNLDPSLAQVSSMKEPDWHPSDSPSTDVPSEDTATRGGEPVTSGDADAVAAATAVVAPLGGDGSPFEA